ncbi:TPA: TIGR04255 family protein [Vibrio parahaemolyticus]|nr:TIGR04255 family protein [Vibrio parahaemolyticus]
MLPKALTVVPIIDAVIELRFRPKIKSLSSVLSGILYSELKANDIQKTPHSDLPDAIRNNDEILKYKPVTTLLWDEKYRIFISDYSIALGCLHPYQGWEAFRSKIDELIKALLKTDLIEKVERNSLKYINLIETPKGHDLSKYFNIDFGLGGDSHDLSKLSFNFEKKEGENLVILTTFSGTVSATINDGEAKGKVINGTLLNVDTINVIEVKPEQYDNLLESFDRLHEVEKDNFFSLLSKDGLDLLGAKYE